MNVLTKSADLAAGSKQLKKITDGNVGQKRHWILHLIFILLCALFLYPVLLTIIVSFTDEAAIASNGYQIIPEKWSLEGYRYAIQNAGILNAYKITIMSSVTGTFLSVMVMQMYAYPLSRKDFKHKNIFTYFAYFSTFLSGGLVPWYIVCTQVLNIGNTFWALVLPSLMSPMYIIILRTFISSNVHSEMLEAAKIDGAGEHRIFWQIVMPLSKPGLATISLFQLLAYWNDYYLPMMLITEDSLYNLQYYLQVMFQNIEILTSGIVGNNAAVNMADIPKEATRMAMCVLTMGPILLVYPFFQKYFVKGLTVGAVKG